MGARRSAVAANPAAKATVSVLGRWPVWDEAEADNAMTLRGVGSTAVLLALLAGTLVLYWVELPSLTNPVPSLLAVFVVMVASVVVTRPEPFRLRTISTALVCSAAVAAVALSTIAPPELDVIGYESRHVAISTVLLVMVVLRGRIILAWFGRVSVMAVIILSSVVSQDALSTRLVAFLGNTAILLAATVLVIWLTRSRRLTLSKPEH
jgi:hypothetical protein